ncbi:MAG: FAD:protein FMN transferase [Candidatus Omnitrophica bacterium]|nr:FAD:protein FMN transferase [Candidatus Omnitrophota bacterium]
MIKKNIVFSFLLFVFFLSQIILLISAKREISREMLIMGTVCRISIVSGKNLSPQQAEAALNNAFALLKDYERRWNFYAKDSELSLINAQAFNQSVKLLPDTREIVSKSLELSALTNGAFDITATSLQRQGGYGTIILEPHAQSVMFSDLQTKIDLGGIATGYAIDQVREVFKNNKVNNYLIDIGGDIYASGKNQKNKFWEIGVRNPFDQNIIISDFPIKDQAVTTSGNYLKKHIIDPQTAVLADNNIESVTVISDSCLEADALATAFFIMGIEQSKVFIDNYKNDIQVLFVKNMKNTPEIVKYNWKKD